MTIGVDRAREARPTAGRLGRWAGRASVAGTAALGLGGFVLSFTALRDLAVRVGMPDDLAWIWPLLIDGLIIEATLAVVRLSQLGRRSWYAWTLLAGGAVVSVASNGIHAVATGHGAAGAAASAVAPVVLLAMTHLTVLLLEDHDQWAVAVAAPAQAPWAQEPAAPTQGATAGAEPVETAAGTDEGMDQGPLRAPTPEPVGQAAPDDGPAGAPGRGEGDDNEDLAAWVRATEACGTRVTGAMVAQRLGCSASTGRRRLARLRAEERPRLRLATS